MTQTAPTPESARPRPMWPVALAALLVLLAGAGAYFFFTRPQPPPVVEQTPAPVAEQPAAPPAEVSVTDYEAKAKELLTGLSAKLSELLGTEGLLRRVVAAVQLASEGQSYLHLFPSLRPTTAFEVQERDGKTFIDPKSYARYDSLTDVIAAVDPNKAAEAYAAVSPALEQLYREVARPGSKFSDALAKALSPIAHAQISDAPVELTPKGLVWAFKDTDREVMNPTSKLLVRMGPQNARKLQSFAQAFVAAAKL